MHTKYVLLFLPSLACERRVMTHAVIVENLSKVYTVGDSKLIALNKVNLNLEHGQFVAVVGTSGSGKSTLLNMLGGLERPTIGKITVAGHRLDTYTESELVTFRRENIGFIFQSFNLMPHLNATQNVALPLSFRGVPKQQREAAATSILKQLGLGEHLHHRPSQLSGGQQQRVGIARALVVKPRVVFADEPTGNLDSATAADTLNLFRRANRKFGQTWIMVTHDPEIAAYADTVVSIRDGKINNIETISHPVGAQ